MSKTNYLENKVLDAVLNNVSLAVAQPYVALHTGDPGETGTANEATGANGVARLAASFAAASGGSCANDVELLFAAATADLGTITYVSLWDTARASGAAQSGNCLWSGPLGSPGSQAVPTGVQFRLAVGALVVSDD
jgi:hypothetical protein